MNNPPTRIRRIVPMAACLLLAAPRALQKPPSSSECKKLIAAYLEFDGRTAEGFDEQQKILASLAAVPSLQDHQIKSWKKDIARAQGKGRQLEKKGDNWYHEDKKAKIQKGRYVVAGFTSRPQGLLIGMHGGGVGEGDAGSSASGWGSACSQYKLVGIFPEVLEKTECGWTDAGTEEFVLDLVDAALRTWDIDPDRVYFGGHSMGGYGSWTLGAHHADRLAAIAPAAGAPTPYLERGTDRVLDLVKGVIPNLRNLWAVPYQSRDDPKVPPGPTQLAVQRLVEAGKKWGGYEHEYWEVDGRGHDRPPGGTAAHLAKIIDHKRNALPERIVWEPDLAWKRQFYWLHWQQPVRHALLIADLDRAANTIRIQCDKPTGGLSVLLDERLVDLDKEVVVVVNDKEVFRGKPEPTATTLLLTGIHPDPVLQFTCRVPAHE